MKNTAAIVLAAGKGKRMKSDLPKVLHEILGKPMLRHVLDTLKSININKIAVVVGHKAEMVQSQMADFDGNLDFILQAKQLGTGHAVMVTEEALADFEGNILVVAGDVPFLSQETTKKLIEVHEHEGAAATVLSSRPDDPTGYGRVIRQPGTDLVDYIIEHKDASDEERKVNEINTGIFCFDSRYLFESLKEIRSENSQNEYYLTDIMAILRKKGLKAAVSVTDDTDEVLGVNSVEQKDELERKFAGRR
ncbi:MAG: NTP transferase domain-containing protein [candidate division Zixibacteria bacterium]|nr:NTP transferase domain-containing protein [candidate division Zixibacteria bacterium]